MIQAIRTSPLDSVAFDGELLGLVHEISRTCGVRLGQLL